jgi:8-oxo-dGTP pyrophosphatase MutT (NUDIX family)
MRSGEACREQVAAVCYRFSNAGLEFLLVQTRSSRRWTFPKGCLEAGMTRSQAAAKEAFEEAGVHGSIEEAPFARYTRHRRGSAAGETIVQAYLCEVLRLGRPEEAKRNPTWYSAEKTKRRLREGRSPEDAAEFARVVDRAVVRIRRLRTSAGAPPDELQRVVFEAPEASAVHTQIEQASFARYIRGRDGIAGADAIELAVGTRMSRVLQFAQRQQASSVKLLGSGKKNR